MKLNRKLSLKKNHDIEKLFKNKQSVGSSYYAIYYKVNDTRVAISASKKVGNSVVRNYQKRVIREILRHHLDLIINYNILVIIKPKCIELTYNMKEKEIIKLLERMRKQN